MKKRNVLILFLFLCSFFVEAQNLNNKAQLAYQYYRDKEFDKAAELYQQLYQKSHSLSHLKYLVRSREALSEYDYCIKFLKKESKSHKDNPNIPVLLGEVYEKKGAIDKANKIYLKYIDKLPNNRHRIIALANAFLSNRKYKYAEKTYLKGRKLTKGEYSFSYELANVYLYARDYSKMIAEYLDVLEQSDAYIRSIQNKLQATVYAQDDESLRDLLKKALIRRIQKTKKNIFSELLIWLYIQEKEFSKAMLQTKALDKKLKENGYRLIKLGDIALNNKDYKTASEAYQYVMQKGEKSPLYISSKVKYLKSLKAEVLSLSSPSSEKIQKLLQLYNDFIADLGVNNETLDLVISKAHLLAFYLNKEQEGIDLLENTLNKLRLNIPERSQLKLELADQLMMQSDVWQATLYYSQIIKDNPNNPVGNKAKLRKAKLAYYAGDFVWAKAQLDVLKASTEKLIANDAFALSSLIENNLPTDSLDYALQWYAKADLLTYQNKKDSAIALLDSILQKYPNHSLVDEVLFKKGNIFESESKNEKAKACYQKIIDQYYQDILADNSMMHLAALYEKEGNEQKAMEIYTQLLVDFSDSFFALKARRKIQFYRDH